MERVGAFPAKLALVLRALSLSRVALAHDLAVDKSLIGRWLSGAVHPTEHNLARLTALVAERRAEFTLADWYRETPDLAARLGVAIPETAVDLASPELAFLGPFLIRSREETARRGQTYEGFWRTTRPSMLEPDTLFHDYGMIRRGGNGLLEVRMKGAGLAFGGWMLPGEGNLFVFLDDPVGMTPLSLVFRGVTLPRAMVLDGLLMLAALDPGRTLGAVPILLERIDDLSDDAEADEARFAGLVDAEPIPLDPLDEALVRQRLYRGSGPQAGLAGNARFLSVGAQDSHSRGTTGSGLSG